jgi:hypothetical protein
VHEPDAPELRPAPALAAVLERGQHIGELAREEFPGGVLVEREPWEIAAKVVDTRSALEAGAPAIFEASFVADGVFVAVDLLERRGDGHVLVEVKSTYHVKPQFVPDVAIQLHVLRASGLKVDVVELMHLQRRRAGAGPSTAFIREDVSPAAEAFLPSIDGHLQRMRTTVDGALPDVEPGSHCTDPYDCPFVPRCDPARTACGA